MLQIEFLNGNSLEIQADRVFESEFSLHVFYAGAAMAIVSKFGIKSYSWKGAGHR